MALPATTYIQRDTGHVSQLAAVELNLRSKEDQSYLADALAYSRMTGAKAWKHYGRLGVVRYPLNRAARIAGATNLFAATVDDEGNVEGPIQRGDSNAAAIDIVRKIYARIGGVRGLIERYFLLQKIPADSHLIRVKVRGGYDGYMFLSPNELRGPAGQEFDPTADFSELRWQTAPGGAGRAARDRPIAKRDYLGRMWTPSPQWVDNADSPLFTLDADCDLLWRLQTLMRASARQRAIFAGMLFLPDTLNRLAAGKHTAHKTQDLVDTLNKVLAENADLDAEGDAVDIMPVILSGQPDAGAQIREIVLGQEMKETDLQLRDELMNRILFSLDINTRATTGDSQNHFSAWSDNADELRLAVMPDVEAMCWGLTRLILHRELLDLGWEPDRIAATCIWYDLSAASVRINRQEDARQLVDRIQLSGSVARHVAGFTEDDAPDDVERIRQVGVLTKNPYLALWDVDADIDWELAGVKPAGRPADSPADEAPSEPGEGDPGSPDDIDNEVNPPPDAQ